MAKALKGKYFPNSKFFEASPNSNASFTWKSIPSAKEVVLKGVCRVIGNGQNTCIWRDPWLPSFEDSKIPNRDKEGRDNELVYVSELIQEGRWNRDILTQVFQPWEIQAIQKLPLPIHDMDDTWMWKHTQSGVFSVKSVYFIER